MRETVRFADAVRAAAADIYLEIGPDGSLTALGHDGFVPAVRREQPEAEALLAALARLHVAGAPIDWAAVLPAGHPADLPTYAFQHERYWLDAGPAPTGHPLIDRIAAVPDSGGVVLGARLSTAAHPWLADHVVAGSRLVPGTLFVELALRAGHEVGYAEIAELVLHTPLVVPDGAAVAIEIEASAEDDGGRPFTVRAWRDGDETWTVHADGRLVKASAAAAEPLPAWPPAGATPVPVSYSELAGAGMEYGPAFQGLRALWRRGDELFAEVTAPAGAESWTVHPALLDACLHGWVQTGPGRGRLPFSWSGVRVAAPGATGLRVRLAPAGPDMLSVTAEDPGGTIVLAARSLALRPSGLGRLFHVDWREIPAGPVRDTGFEVLDCTAEPATAPAGVHESVSAALTGIQRWLAGDGEKLVVSTRGWTGEAVRGLVRCAQREHPGRIVLVRDAAAEDLPAAVATGEPEVAVRDGRLYAPRLAPAPPGRPWQWDGTGVVLVTGGTGTLGRAVARHLVERWQARDVVLAGRGDRDADVDPTGRARVVRCDVSDRAQVRALLDGLGPVRLIVHAAGVTDDGTVTSLSTDRVSAVLRPKVDGAWHLHELAGPETTLVFFSSAAGVLGSAGQASYGAANAFLDGLAAHRRSLGLHAVSVDWGLWAERSALSAGLTDADRARIRRTGIEPLATAEALAMFDAALGAEPAAVVAARLATGGDSPMLSGLAGTWPVARPATDRPGGLAGTPPAMREQTVARLVRTHVAAVLGHDRPERIADDAGFMSLGITSLGAVDLRNRLNEATGLRLPATVLFEHPTTGALARHVGAELWPEPEPGPEPGPAGSAALATASADAVLDFIRRELGGK
ncbi:type I polyketide synthase [Micromonospora halophytica]|uniref:type I polyketide synthase n=1 Tax=Micromonospora halophytica TaxID=47864 RepID=UPI00147EA240|nr:type I polyketide synthase [Micromonospora halophytica]